MLEEYAYQLDAITKHSLDEEEFLWLANTLKDIANNAGDQRLYIGYSLCASKVAPNKLRFGTDTNEEVKDYLLVQEFMGSDIARLWLLRMVLLNDNRFETPVRKIIEVADRNELEVFLKGLVFLPEPNRFQFAAVEALRTNISTVFEAISKYNPYPAKYFSEQQWNQMYLKGAFMQLDLSTIMDIDQRANKNLVRIISDYARERWAASRSIDPYFWRPVSNFIEGNLVDDVRRLFNSDDLTENGAAALVCYHSDLTIGDELLKEYPTLKLQVEQADITWENLKN